MNPLASAARALLPELELRVRLYADALAQSLRVDLGLVAWDREQLIGGLQQRLHDLEPASIIDDDDGVRVVERRGQPLESIDAAWGQLLAGRPVRVEHEPGACQAALELLRGMARACPAEVGPAIVVAAAPRDGLDLSPSVSAAAFARALRHEPTLWPIVGPPIPGPRVAEVQAEADRELAAYVLARASLRRTGTDPRAVKYAFVAGPTEVLQRHLVRLWVGATMGPPTSPEAFAGPVERDTQTDFLSAIEAWGHHPEVDAWCPGGVLERPEDGHFVAPALFACDWPPPDLPLCGPMLVVVHCGAPQARARAEATVRDGGQWISVGPQAVPRHPDITHVRGALLVERLPPGLPPPRPV